MVSAMFVFANSSSPATLHAYSFMAASNLLIYLDGKIVPESEAKISVFDHGLLYGDGCFEGIRIYNGRVFRLTEHLVRLYESARSICLTIPISLEEMEKATVETVAANNLRDGYSASCASGARPRRLSSFKSACSRILGYLGYTRCCSSPRRGAARLGTDRPNASRIVGTNAAVAGNAIEHSCTSAACGTIDVQRVSVGVRLGAIVLVLLLDGLVGLAQLHRHELARLQYRRPQPMLKRNCRGYEHQRYTPLPLDQIEPSDSARS